MPKLVRIQPAEMPDGTLPYPFFINSKGLVGRQDFWNGQPYRLLGFSKKFTPGTMEISFKEFWAKPKIAIKKHAVMSNKKGEWFTYPDHIESVIIETLDKKLDKGLSKN